MDIFKGILQLLNSRTKTRFLSRVSFDLERKLQFLMGQVRQGNRRRYMEWLAKQHFSAPENINQIPDIIRYICACIHPTNEVLASDICPRWMIVDWLLQLGQTSMVVASKSKLALFYDWMFFDPSQDNIMNIGMKCFLDIFSRFIISFD